MKMRKPIVLLALLCALTLCGCDALVTYQFRVQNGTTQPILLTYNRKNTDTTIVMDPNAEVLILEMQEMNSSVKPYFKPEDSIWWFRTLYAELDSTRSTLPMKLAKNWEFKAVDGLGKYNLTLTGDHFK